MSLQRKSVSQKLTSRSKEQKEYFNEVLDEAGIKFSANDEVIKVVQEQSLIIRDMEKSIRVHVNYPKNTKLFIAGLKTLSDDETNFQKALSCTYLQKSIFEELVESNAQQDSLFRIMLNVNCIQTEVIDILLDKLMNLVCKNNDDVSELRLILNALRYLPYISEPLQLTTKILDALEIASTKTQQLEIMHFIPDIVPDNQCDEAAKQLSKLLEDNDDLAGAIIDCLNALHFSAAARANIQEYIVNRFLASKRFYKIFPILFEFLITDCKPENIVSVLRKCRNTLDIIMSTEDAQFADIVSIKVMIFKKLQYLVCKRKTLFEALITMMSNIKDYTDHKPVDLLLLFVLHTACKSKKKIVELFFKKRIKSSLFRISLVEKLFKEYLIQQFVNDYFDTMIEIGASLLRNHTDVLFMETASIFFKLLFVNDKTSKMQRNQMLFNLIMLSGSKEEKTISAVLGIFQDLINEPKLGEHTQQLMGLLDKLDNLHLKNTKKLFEILCRLTCAEDIGDNQIGLKDELNILVRKQLSIFRREVKSRGIIAAIVMVKYIATTKTETVTSDANCDETIISIDDLPKGPAYEAATLLNLANTCARGFPEMMSLYYDQVATMLISAEYLNKYFMNWLFETITRDFQDFFIVQNIPEPINDVILTAQYCINTSDELEDAVSVNIAELSMKSHTSQNSILILSPLFRLLRILHQKQNKGDLSSIDALEGCGVIMPEVQDIQKFELDQLKQACDCVFHCINWFREIVSAFVTQTNKTIRKKVILRLMNLIELEDLLNTYMSNVPDHKLPISYYSSTTIKGSPVQNIPKKAATKRFKSNPVVNDTVASTSASGVVKATQNIKRTVKICDNHYKFREIDVDVIILLKYPLNINKANDDNNTYINIKQFQFILKDFVAKLVVLNKNKDVGVSNLNVMDMEPMTLILDCRKLIPNINKQTKVIVENITELLGTFDNRYDAPELFSETANDLKLAFALSLEFSEIIFSWVGFQNNKNLNLLQDCLKGFRENQSSQVFASVYRFIIEYINRLFTYIDQCLYLPSAVSIIEIMQSLYKVHAVPEVRKVITSASEKLLKKRWYNISGTLETGKNAYANIDVLVKAYLGDTKIKTLCAIVATLQNEVADLKTKTDYLQMLGSIDKANFHVFYRGLCCALSKHVRNEISSLTNNEHLILWRTTALTMQGLMTIAKVHETKTNLICFLKNSIAILKTFLSHGIPILEIMLKSKSDQVLEIFKIMQTSTRFLHHLCCYSKVTKDAGLINLVPQFRLTLETLLYRVKAALAANNCSEAFWMGNLRNRDLQGDDILSQSSASTEVNDDGSNDELPADESDEDIEMGNDTASQIYATEENSL